MRRLLTPRNDNVIDLTTGERPVRRQLVEKLFEQYARDLRRFLLAQSVPPEQVDGVVQELFTRLMDMKQLEMKMSEATGSSRSYLLTMANHMMADRRRKQRVRRAYADAQQAIERERMDEQSPERIVAAQLELEAMRAVIREMRLNWRVAFVLQRFGNLSYADIALHMGVTVRQVERYLRRAMRRIEKARRKIKAAGEKSC